jgi:hypothetical protein
LGRRPHAASAIPDEDEVLAVARSAIAAVVDTCRVATGERTSTF